MTYRIESANVLGILRPFDTEVLGGPVAGFHEGLDGLIRQVLRRELPDHEPMTTIGMAMLQGPSTVTARDGVRRRRPERSQRVRVPASHGYKPRLAQSPVIAHVMPGTWMFTNSHVPSGLKRGPANSE